MISNNVKCYLMIADFIIIKLMNMEPREASTHNFNHDEEENELDNLDFMTELEELRALMDGKIVNAEGDIVNVEIEDENELDSLDFMVELEKLRPLLDGKIVNPDGDIIDISHK
ncbi:unnamed protein product [Blepharisma stoltei]|uniref:Uncharacterized protein n=1 Tax=Blepharisma stoltei TaxID=1481888 RepID=A0AAU9JBW2_9CILI|nr:unnamed protein product [Blepharisma stoltei]